MSDYAIGDVQGCYDPLQRLLDRINFNENEDRLWFVGDLVNRGPQSLAVLRFIRNLPIKPIITLGNHDLHLLAMLFVKKPAKKNHDDTLHEVLAAEDSEELGHWLRKQSVLHYDPALGVVMCHAGIAPVWDLDLARACAHELEDVLAGDNFSEFLTNMYGNEPNHWSNELTGIERLRVITNYFTRMRFCDSLGNLVLSYKGTLDDAPENLIPWYEVPSRKPINADIVFGHWAALEGHSPDPTIFAIDTGCLWGGRLTALRLQDRQRISVPGLKS
ncbi:symmetrical bis(5'-nucleosyl)-tetraphosphatase [Legionella micdadei]|uniref:Bis(5'-nucleosyl)-tetraphosphatase, symmetrical n=1 Tax=Legionella micdadei TaxID=451 RepID=A0A098GLE1_LEGMI|nr:symmetrical bis(5'-nucleosyl)-tetraphosphatase [Legionella micdadei]ARG98723.1 bis(5'-nucleosyl)-tetraphosphatase (symmetrical) [Legionella micdadei]ARH01442.1 bis(5'-nucleosyl)-tetraphosphatase (symmetrical) [Legionella micdadei]KTD28940.1 bis(5'-nucleosyl)-tetraphosphatase [Legionella micdadei]NSL17152.1 symmetrical bis(5'-nucleosyl)-tetraphosphatase [Legionella micdadei]CEG62321.1 Bis(5'-nucleosyl)-tetraphosphatase, symmetrical [Legionella micdadei]